MFQLQRGRVGLAHVRIHDFAVITIMVAILQTRQKAQTQIWLVLEFPAEFGAWSIHIIALVECADQGHRMFSSGFGNVQEASRSRAVVAEVRQRPTDDFCGSCAVAGAEWIELADAIKAKANDAAPGLLLRLAAAEAEMARETGSEDCVC
jgi:hypothetical protein